MCTYEIKFIRETIVDVLYWTMGQHLHYTYIHLKAYQASLRFSSPSGTPPPVTNQKKIYCIAVKNCNSVFPQQTRLVSAGHVYCACPFSLSLEVYHNWKEPSYIYLLIWIFQVSFTVYRSRRKSSSVSNSSIDIAKAHTCVHLMGNFSMSCTIANSCGNKLPLHKLGPTTNFRIACLWYYESWKRLHMIM